MLILPENRSLKMAHDRAEDLKEEMMQALLDLRPESDEFRKLPLSVQEYINKYSRVKEQIDKIMEAVKDVMLDLGKGKKSETPEGRLQELIGIHGVDVNKEIAGFIRDPQMLQASLALDRELQPVDASGKPL